MNRLRENLLFCGFRLKYFSQILKRDFIIGVPFFRCGKGTPVAPKQFLIHSVGMYFALPDYERFECCAIGANGLDDCDTFAISVLYESSSIPTPSSDTTHFMTHTKHETFFVEVVDVLWLQLVLFDRLPELSELISRHSP